MPPTHTVQNSITSFPIAILVLDNNQYIAISPQTYYSPTPTDDASLGIEDTVYSQFIATLYNFIGAPLQNNSNIISLTSLGITQATLKEVHIRFIDTPIQLRGDTVWFSCYQHPLTTYYPVHTHSPITFSHSESTQWRLDQPELLHMQCRHIIIPEDTIHSPNDYTYFT